MLKFIPYKTLKARRRNGLGDCKNFVPEIEQLPYFKEQVIAWATKAEKFKINVLLHNNYDAIAREFGDIVEILEWNCYNGK